MKQVDDILNNWWAIRAERSALEDQVKAKKKQEEEIKTEMLNLLNALGADHTKAKNGSITRVVKSVVNIPTGNGEQVLSNMFQDMCDAVLRGEPLSGHVPFTSAVNQSQVKELICRKFGFSEDTITDDQLVAGAKALGFDVYSKVEVRVNKGSQK